MTALVIAEHDNASIKGATFNTVTAAAACGGDVHVLVAGHNAGAAAAQAAQIAGVGKVIHADAEGFAHGLAENIAAQVLAIAGSYSHIKGSPVTTEAVMEGRSGDFYGGWGFYFVRKYLSESSVAALGDDPMAGLEESMKGIYLPPGAVRDKLMVYDLNRICDDPSKGREVPVPGQGNLSEPLWQRGRLCRPHAERAPVCRPPPQHPRYQRPAEVPGGRSGRKDEAP